jgi:hypothetical protein
MVSFMLRPLYSHLTGGRMGSRNGVDAVKTKIPNRTGDRNPVVQPVLTELSDSHVATYLKSN